MSAAERAQQAAAACPFRGTVPHLLDAYRAAADARSILEERDARGGLEPHQARLEALADAMALLEHQAGDLAGHACEACEPAVAAVAAKCQVSFDYALGLVREAQELTLRKLTARMAPASSRAERRRQDRETDRARRATTQRAKARNRGAAK